MEWNGSGKGCMMKEQAFPVWGGTLCKLSKHGILKQENDNNAHLQDGNRKGDLEWKRM